MRLECASVRAHCARRYAEHGIQSNQNPLLRTKLPNSALPNSSGLSQEAIESRPFVMDGTRNSPQSRVPDDDQLPFAD
jgi:hypothetical protein